MARNFTAITLLLLLAITPAARSDPAWVSLFNGEDLSGWRTYGADQPHPKWQVKDGTLVLTEKGGGDLITREMFSNFELELEWWISKGGNSGVFILADESELPIFVHAPEVQILDDAGHPDNTLATHRSGSLYDMVAAPPASQKPAEQWNTLRIRHVNGNIQVWQNDVAVTDITIGSPVWQEKLAQSKFATWPGFAEQTQGHIGLQDHGNKVAFRNIRIRPL